MRLFLQYAASGLATGCAFALVATGFVAIYRVTRVVNFAQGVFAVLAGMMAYTLLAIGVPHFVAEALAVLAAVVAGALVGFVAIGRRGTSQRASFRSAVGMAIRRLSAAAVGGRLRPGAALVGGVVLGVAEALVAG